MKHSPKKILIAALDWGLGHTTRSIALARYYHQNGHKIYFAGNEIQRKLFLASCPYAEALHLEGYNIHYAQNKALFMPKLMSQLGKINSAIRRERFWLAKQMEEHVFDVILSDNRYGLYHADATCILLTHQLHIQTGTLLGNAFIKKVNQFLINRFDACWVVDNDAHPIAGKLSQSISLQVPIKYIGWLSQFENVCKNTSTLDNSYILAIISGPEPMRTQLETKLIAQMQQLSHQQFVVVGGTDKHTHYHFSNIQYLPLADGENLFELISNAQYIISRSGYTTVMDCIQLRKKAIFIPTPGQTEQEYLAKHLEQLGYFATVAQHEIDLRKFDTLLKKTTLPPFSQDIPHI